MTELAKTLEGLSAAATRGACEVLTPDTEHDFGVPIVATDYPGTYGPTNGLVLWATMQPTEIDAKDTSRAEANAAFTAALWNAYRTGQLVPAQSGDVEAVARALAVADGIEICSDAIYALSSYGIRAQAAIAAMTSAKDAEIAEARRQAFVEAAEELELQDGFGEWYEAAKVIRALAERKEAP